MRRVIALRRSIGQDKVVVLQIRSTVRWYKSNNEPHHRNTTFSFCSRVNALEYLEVTATLFEARRCYRG